MQRLTTLYGASITELVAQINDTADWVSSVVYIGKDKARGGMFVAVLDTAPVQVMVFDAEDDVMDIEFIPDLYNDVRSA